uniref:Uncharacterized protein n=1 Tax=Podoviridae sp. ctrTt13 TaxID=2825279 RepID=A0A8S5NTR1_9CAUD|nr:MAG TPA: hypothetical protein [Podoviridae sp. ctrTt13]
MRRPIYCPGIWICANVNLCLLHSVFLSFFLQFWVILSSFRVFRLPFSLSVFEIKLLSFMYKGIPVFLWHNDKT